MARKVTLGSRPQVAAAPVGEVISETAAIETAADTFPKTVVRHGVTVKLLKTEKGREVGFRELAVYDSMQLAANIDPIRAQNERYYQFCLLGAAVAMIDGEFLPPPQNELECQMAVKRLGDDGYKAFAEEGERRRKEAEDAEIARLTTGKKRRNSDPLKDQLKNS